MGLNMSDIKICVSTMLKLNSKCIESPMYINVQSGAIFDEYVSDKLVGDNTGDNISNRNRNYSELSVQYWAWKNIEADYYGLCHYRRFLSFCKKKKKTDVYGFYLEKEFNDDNIEKHKLCDEKLIQKVLEKYDIITKSPSDCTKMPLPDKTYAQNELDFWNNQKMRYVLGDTIDLIKEAIVSLHPDYEADLVDFLKGKQHYGYNLFIMKKKLFDEMCSFEFDILFYVESKTDICNYGGYLRRIYGYVGEILYSVFIIHMKRTKGAKIKMIPGVMFEDVKDKEIAPKSNAVIPIVTYFNDYRIPELGVFLQSLLSCKRNDTQYEVIVVNNDITMESKSIILDYIKKHENVAVNFVNFSKEYDGILQGAETKSYPDGRYLPILLPWLLKKYNRLLFLNRNTLVVEDLTELYNTNLSDAYFAATVDYVRQGVLNLKTGKRNDYEESVLKMKDPYRYYNTSVLLIDARKVRQAVGLEDVVNNIKESCFIKHESDLFNLMFNEKTKRLSIKWNYCTAPDEKMKKELSWTTPESGDEYLKCNGGILNYMSSVKPWNNPWKGGCLDYWMHARSSPLYEMLIKRLVSKK